MLQRFHEQKYPLSSSADEEQSIIGCQKMVELKHQVYKYFFQLETPWKKAFVQLIYENYRHFSWNGFSTSFACQSQAHAHLNGDLLKLEVEFPKKVIPSLE